MMERIKISTAGEYSQYKDEGREPLLDPQFLIEINLRKQIQDQLFGDEESNPVNRRRLFLWLWDRKPHVCEETGAYLGLMMNSEYMSHILSRGAHIELWNDPRNINILCPDAHRKWETGKKEKMIIWRKNQEIIAMLKSEYSALKTYKSFGKEADNKEKDTQLMAIFKKVFDEGSISGAEAFDEWWEENKEEIHRYLINIFGR